MLKSAFLKLLAAGLAVMAAPAMAQITEIDPNTADQYQTPAEEGYTDPYAVDPADTPAYPETEYQPVDPGLDQGMDAAPADTVPAATAVTAAPRETVPREDILTAADDVSSEEQTTELKSLMRSSYE